MILESTDVGTPGDEQRMSQIEAFSREQIAAVASVLTPQQLDAYEQLQHERVAQQRSFGELRKKLERQTQ